MTDTEWAIQQLIQTGNDVAKDPKIPGLYWVNGHEVTTAQMVYVAHYPQRIPNR